MLPGGQVAVRLIGWGRIPMQGSFWKTVAVVGVIGIGSLAILEVQHNLHRKTTSQEPLGTDPLGAEAVAANLITGDQADLNPIDAPLEQSDFDRLMATATAGANATADGGFDMSEPPVESSTVSQKSPFYGAEPIAPQANTPPVDTQVNIAAMEQGGNPFSADSEASADSGAESPMVSANYQANGNETVQPVGFTEFKPFPGDNAASGSESPAAAANLEPFRREGVDQINDAADAVTFPAFDSNPSDTKTAATPNTDSSPATQFFGANSDQTNAATDDKTAQFYGTPENSLQPAPDAALAAPFDEDPPSLNSTPTTPVGGATPAAFDNDEGPFFSDPGTPAPGPFEDPVSDASPAERPMETRPFDEDEDTVPVPRDPNPLSTPEPQPGGFGSNIAPAQPQPDFGLDEPPTSNSRPSGRNAMPRDSSPLPFAEDEPTSNTQPPGRLPDVVDTPPLSIPVPNNSLSPEPPPYDGRDNSPNPYPEPRTFEPQPYSPPRDSGEREFPPMIDPPSNGTRDFNGGREFNGGEREFNGGDRDVPLRDPQFETPSRGFDDLPAPRTDPSFGDDRGFGSDRIPDYDNRRRELEPGNLRSPDDLRSPDELRPLAPREPSNIRPVSGTMRPNLVLQKTAPRNASVGTPLDYNIIVRNDGDATAYDVVVEDDVKPSAEVIGAAPNAKINHTTQKLMWTFDKVEPGETKEITVRVVPTGEGTLDGVATVHSKSRVQATTVVTAPRLRLQMAGPAEVRLGEEVAYRYVITNEGSGEARDVFVRTVLPEGGGLKHPAGNDIEYEVKSLQPGAQREIVLAVVAAEPGEFRAEAEVSAAGGAKDQASWKTNIIGAQLNIVRRGPKRRYVSRSATFENIISNETNVEAFDAKVVESVPEGMKFMGANRNGRYDERTRQVTWTINRLGPGKQETLQIELMPTTPGSPESVVQIFENAGLQSGSAASTTVVEDLHNVSADISRLDGPVALGETFGFTVTVDNRGTADATNVKLLIDVPAEMKVLGAGSREVRANIDEDTNQVMYEIVGRIPANKRQTFEVKLQGTRPVNNKVVSARVQYEQMERPLVVSESVTVYEEL